MFNNEDKRGEEIANDIEESKPEETDSLESDSDTDTEHIDIGYKTDFPNMNDIDPEESGVSGSDTESGNNDTIEIQLNSIQGHLDRLEKEFQSKFKYDQHKEKIIDNLHKEVQEYKADLIKRLLQPIIMDIIYVINPTTSLSW